MVAKGIGATAALVVALLLTAVAPAFAAFPGDVLYVDQVFKSGVVGDDTGVDVKVDAANEPIIAAQSATGADAQEYLFWSYTPAGVWRGEGHWNGPGSTFETVNDQALDGGGRALVVGSTTTAAGGDMYLVCRNNDGSEAWAAPDIFNGAANKNDEAMAVTVDSVGDAAYTGMSENAAGNMDVVTVMVDQDGNRLWSDRYNSPYDRFDAGFAITKYGNAVYVAGTSNRKGHGDDLLVIRYNATSGDRTWVRRYDDVLHRNEHVSDIVATSKSVYVCGSGKFGAVAPGDAMIARYSSSGARQWVRFFSGGGAFDEMFTDMQRSPANGYLVVTGFGSRKASQQDWLTASYRPDGTLHWGRWVTSYGKKSDVASALDVDARGRIFVTGSVESASHGSDVRTVGYNAAGATRWGTDGTDFWNNEVDNGDDVPWDIEVSSDAVWVTGTTYTAANGNDMLTIKYKK